MSEIIFIIIHVLKTQKTVNNGKIYYDKILEGFYLDLNEAIIIIQ